MARTREVIETFGMPIYELDGFEADDLLGTLARQAGSRGIDTYLMSMDSDIAQLVDGKAVAALDKTEDGLDEPIRENAAPRAASPSLAH